MNYINNYRQMRLILIYDLPTIDEIDRKIYNKFHNQLKKNGFYMLQYSVYIKVLSNDSSFTQIHNKLQKIVPKKGSVIAFKLTEKQFQSMLYLRGEQNLYETIVGGNELVIFKGDEDD
ncbi:MAG TPA: CRISPR-associated endonuclease Cas2 [Tenericutes bacterium]|nr:CRISPR-associated endonuclease Cas2 [Mycoplasmatota bacterium]